MRPRIAPDIAPVSALSQERRRLEAIEDELDSETGQQDTRDPAHDVGTGAPKQ